MSNSQHTFDSAVRSHQAGDLLRAEQLYRQVLADDARHADALHHLGLLCRQQGNSEQAVAYIRQALQLRPDLAEAHYNLGNALSQLGKLEEATASYTEAVRLRPGYVEAHNNLGNALKEIGRLEEAAANYRAVVHVRPNEAGAHQNLGNTLLALGRPEEAEASLRQAAQLQPSLASAQDTLGRALLTLGQMEEAAACFRKAIRLAPDLADSHVNLGMALLKQGKTEEVVACYRQALRLEPNLPEVLYNLGVVLQQQGQFGEAAACYERALQVKPDHMGALLNLSYCFQGLGRYTEAIGLCQRALEREPNFASAFLNMAASRARQGDLDEAAVCYRHALELNPDSPSIRHGFLNSLHYCPGVSLAQLHNEHREYESRLAAPYRAAWRPHDNDRDPDRPLRLGFVSPHFHQHPVGYFLINALERLDRAQAAVVCYSNTVGEDSISARFRSAASQWREMAAWTDEQLAQQIRDDRIDILFDLAGHTGGNRLLVFARKPAPIQITWLDYVGTTGLAAMDYILADPQEIPAAAEPWYCERVLRLPDDYICYAPPAHGPAVGPLPARAGGAITFGSFSILSKITPQVVATWARILHRLPTARMIVKNLGLDDLGTRSRYLKWFVDNGVAAGRVDLVGWSPQAELLAWYNRVDIALDTFPYNGGLTTCEALWMGVPVITCPGETFAARHGLTHLTTVGLTEMIAQDHDQYVELAVGLAQDLPRLEGLRRRLRQQVEASPLCDARRFAGNLLALLRTVWREWIAARKNNEESKIE